MQAPALNACSGEHPLAREIGMCLQAHLQENVDFLAADPLRSGRSERGPILAGLALNLTVFDREIDFSGTGIAVHDLEFRAEQIVADAKT